MASNFFDPNSIDLDNLFELSSDFPQFSVGANTGCFFTGGQDLGTRYIRRFGTKRADVGYRFSIPGQAAYTETINEGGEIITIEYPAVPASEVDLSELYCPKGAAAGYINFPYLSPPSPATTFTHTIYGTASGSGSLAASRLFTFDVMSILFNQSFVVSQIDLVSGSLISGSIYSALAKSGGIFQDGTNTIRYLQRFTVGLTTTTSYTGGYGTSEAVYRVTFKSIASNGNHSDSAGSSHTAKTVTFDVVLTHVVNPPSGGDGEPIQ